VFPRSASEAVFDSGTKYRQLPCRTFISVGTCPYRERCVYLHDPRCICREAKTKTRRKNKDDIVLDSLFWPIMPYNAVAQKLDNNRQPHVIQPYNVPSPQPDQFRHHDEAVYSMWMHFVDFCLATGESTNVPYANLAPCFAAPDLPINAYTQLPRLAVFRVLSAANNQTIVKEDILSANMEYKEETTNDFAAKATLRKLSSSTGDSTLPAPTSSPTRSQYGLNAFNGPGIQTVPFNAAVSAAAIKGGASLPSPNCVNMISPHFAAVLARDTALAKAGFATTAKGAGVADISNDNSFINDYSSEASRRSSLNELFDDYYYSDSAMMNEGGKPIFT
jgi:hypothetical protein